MPNDIMMATKQGALGLRGNVVFTFLLAGDTCALLGPAHATEPTSTSKELAQNLL